MSCHAVNHTTDKEVKVVIGTIPCQLMPSIMRRQLRGCRYESTCVCSIADEASYVPLDRKDTIRLEAKRSKGYDRSGPQKSEGLMSVGVLFV